MVLALAMGIAGEVDEKVTYAFVGHGGCGKETLRTALCSAFEGLITHAWLGTKKEAAERIRSASRWGRRILWINDVRALASRGRPDGNLLKRVAGGGNPFEAGQSCANPDRHEFTMILNCDAPAVGERRPLRVLFPKRYVDEPSEPFHKKADKGLKQRVREDPGFRAGFLWLVLDMYRDFMRSGKAFCPIPEVICPDAIPDEQEDILDALSTRLDFAVPCTVLNGRASRADMNRCRGEGFVTKANVVQDVINDVKDSGRLRGVSCYGVMTQLQLRGFPRQQMRVGETNTKYVIGVKRKAAAAGPERIGTGPRQ